MKIIIVLTHPDPNSFNHAIADTAINKLKRTGHEIIFHDLYMEKFDPILTTEEIPREAPLPEIIKKHCDEIASAEGIIIIHPNWWGQPPAILKGWVDRVIRPDTAYMFREGDQGEGIPVGMLKARAAVVFNTSNTPPLREITVFGDPLELLWKNCVFDLCGIPEFYRETFSVVILSDREQRLAWLRRVEEVLDRHFPAG